MNEIHSELGVVPIAELDVDDIGIRDVFGCGGRPFDDGRTSGLMHVSGYRTEHSGARSKNL